MIKTLNIRKFLFIIGIVFVVIFPKGGIKIAEIPITWGYIYLGLIFAICLLLIAFYSKLTLSRNLVFIYLCTILFIIYFTLNILFRGYAGSLGNLISVYFNFLFFPFLFYIILYQFIKKIEIDFILKSIRIAVFIVCSYGIILFLYKQIVGEYIEIPYLTINAGDVGELEWKYNSRGAFFKLFSTYNNGNIFGLSMLILLPTYYQLETKKARLAVVLLALVLTLSRTVWLGLIFFFLIKYRKKIFTLMVLYITIVVVLLVLTTLVFKFGSNYSSGTNFLLDANLGGRFAQFEQVTTFTFFGETKYWVMQEILYLSIFEQLGMIGLIIFLIPMVSILILYFFNTSNKNKISNSFMLGCIIYLFCCFSDGATILLIPVLAFFYFVVLMSFICVENVSSQ